MISVQPSQELAKNQSPVTRHRSPLELFHPQADAPRALIIGSNCPASLRPPTAADHFDTADLVVLAPTGEECSRGDWLARAIQTMAATLEQDGVGYLLLPRRWRLRGAMLCRHHGLLHEFSVAHVPNLEPSHHLIPLRAAPLHYVTSIISVNGWRRLLLKLGRRWPGVPQLLSVTRSTSGCIVRHPGARPLFEWFSERATDSRPGDVLISQSWRGGAGATVLYRFGPQETVPSVIAKVVPVNGVATSVMTEGTLLPRLAPAARIAGVQVPEILFTGHIGPWAVLVETALAGRAAATVLNEHPGQLSMVLDRVSGWLERWHRRTAIASPVTAQQLEERILVPATRLAPLIERGDDYRDWLAEQCDALAGTVMSFVATHNDLTMLNVLFDSAGRLGVVDWETARENDLPLVDFLYAAVDAVAATEGYADRLKAFQACFVRDGARALTVARLQQRLAQSIQLSPALATVCFHACWLHHATNECHAQPRNHQQPFLDIVRWLARYHSTYDGAG